MAGYIRSHGNGLASGLFWTLPGQEVQVRWVIRDGGAVPGDEVAELDVRQPRHRRADLGVLAGHCRPVHQLKVAKRVNEVMESEEMRRNAASWKAQVEVLK